jgi:hypothetical protein
MGYSVSVLTYCRRAVVSPWRRLENKHYRDTDTSPGGIAVGSPAGCVGAVRMAMPPK